MALLKRIIDKNAKWHVIYDIYEENSYGNSFLVYYVREKSRGDVYDAYILPIEHKEKLLSYKDNSMFHRGNFVREFGKMFIRDGKHIN